mmetsp:Transcript_28470/g.51462  ORF Transcript_28470/g.51462 Transcript_28470/m.51462 type:complete len:286 (+) Transcript_28470:33-890(+)
MASSFTQFVEPLVGLAGRQMQFGQFAATVGSVALSCYGVLHISARGFYSSSKSWQVTILTFHSSAAIALRLAPWGVWLRWASSFLTDISGYTLAEVDDDDGFGILAAAGWLLASTTFRWRHSASPFSLAVAAVEASAAAVPLQLRLLRALLALNLLVVVFFWIAMSICSFSKTFSFVPLDRHLHLGLAHMLRCREAKHSLWANILLHGAQQVCTLLVLANSLGSLEDGMLWPGLRDALAGLTLYWLVVCILTAMAGVQRPYPVSAEMGLLLSFLYWAAEYFASLG